MTWFSDSQIAAQATVGAPIKSQTINRIQQNITAAFNGDSGAPTLAAAVTGKSIALFGLDAVGSSRFMTYTATTGAARFIIGSTYSATEANVATNSPTTISAGTWLCVGGGVTAMISASSFYFGYLFVRVV